MKTLKPECAKCKSFFSYVALAELPKKGREFATGTRMGLAGYGSLGYFIERPDTLQLVTLKISSDKSKH
jgi:hypothetical protein